MTGKATRTVTSDGLSNSKNPILNMIGRAFSSKGGNDLVEEDKAVSAARERAYYSGQDPDDAAQEARIDLAAKRAIRAKSTGKPSDPPTPSMSRSRKPKLNQSPPLMLTIGDEDLAVLSSKNSVAMQLMRFIGVKSEMFQKKGAELFEKAVREVAGHRQRRRCRPSVDDQQLLFGEDVTCQEDSGDSVSCQSMLGTAAPREVEAALKSIHPGRGFSLVSLPRSELESQETLKGNKSNRPFGHLLVSTLATKGIMSVLVSKDGNGMLCAMAIETGDENIANMICSSVNDNGGWLVRKALGHPEWQFLASE